MTKLKKFLLLDFLIFAGISALFLSQSWQKWADPIWDFGREVYVPWRIINGETLYKDLSFLYGAFPPYWNALLFKIFGPSILTLSLFNIFITLFNAALIYRLFYKIFNRLTALMTGIVFLCLFAFNQYLYTHNMYYITPYSHSYFYALFFGLCSINILHIYFHDQKPNRLFFLGVCLGLMLLSRLEIFLTFVIPVIIGLVVFIKKNKMDSTALLRAGVALLTGAYLPLLCFLIYFAHYFSLPDAFLQMIGYNPRWIEVSNLFLYKFMAGYTNWKANLKALGIVVLWYGGLFLALHTFCLGMTLRRRSIDLPLTNGNDKSPSIVGAESRRFVIGKEKVNNWQLGMSVLLIISSAGFLAYAIHIVGIKYIYDVFRGQALFIVLLGMFTLKTFLSAANKKEWPDALFVVIFCGWALLMLLKIPLNSVLYNYGFIYGLPGVLASTAFLTCTIPSHFEQKYQFGWAVRALICAILLIICASVLMQSLGWTALKNKPLSSGANQLWSFDKPFPYGAGSDVEKFLQWAETNIKPGETFVTIPEGIMLNFLTTHKITGPHVSYMPIEMLVFNEQAMLKSLIRQPPDYIVYVNRETAIYNNAVIGRNAGTKILDWIRGQYIPVWFTGGDFSSFQFGIKVLRKNNAAQ